MPTFSGKASSGLAWLCHRWFTGISHYVLLQKAPHVYHHTAVNKMWEEQQRSLHNGFTSYFNNILSAEPSQHFPSSWVSQHRVQKDCVQNLNCHKRNSCPCAEGSLQQGYRPNPSQIAGLRLRMDFKEFKHILSAHLLSRLFHWIYIKHKIRWSCKSSIQQLKTP